MRQVKHYDVKYKEQAVKLAEEKGCKPASDEQGVPYGRIEKARKKNCFTAEIGSLKITR